MILSNHIFSILKHAETRKYNEGPFVLLLIETFSCLKFSKGFWTFDHDYIRGIFGFLFYFIYAGIVLQENN